MAGQTLSILRAFLVLNLSLMALGAIIPRVPAGTQFITGPCQSDSDCASSCCGFKSGKCAGAVIAQERDGGCGFGDAQPNNIAAQAIQGPNAEKPGGGSGSSTPAAAAGANNAAAPAPTSPASAAAPAGTQFITGACTSDADCASGCCGFKSGKCAGAVIAQERDGGCGFGDAQPNNNAAVAIQGPNAEKPGGGNGASSSSPAAAAGANNAAAPAPTSPASAAAPAGTQFITGACTSDADCASGCCGFHSGKCAGAVIAQSRDGGCGFGDAQPNNIAAQKIQGPNAEKPGQ